MVSVTVVLGLFSASSLGTNLPVSASLTRFDVRDMMLEFWFIKDKKFILEAVPTEQSKERRNYFLIDLK